MHDDSLKQALEESMITHNQHTQKSKIGKWCLSGASIRHLDILTPRIEQLESLVFSESCSNLNQPGTKADFEGCQGLRYRHSWAI